jgi:DNA mismatch repair protein MutS
VLTPGTAVDAHLDSEENNFLACVARAGNAVGFAALDLSTGEFRATEFVGDDAERRIREELLVLRPREMLFASSLPLFDQPRATTSQAAAAPRITSIENASWAETPLDDWVFAPDYAIPQVENHFGVLSLEGFGLANRAAAATAAGAILHYVRTTQRGSLDHVDRIGFYERQNCLVLDAVTVRNLELIEPLFAGSGEQATLFRSLDCTVTPMGKRLLRAWMLRPSIDPGEIRQRLDAVESMVSDLSAAKSCAVRWKASWTWSAC